MSPEPPGVPGPASELVVVHIATSSMEAYALRSLLQAEDIPVFIKGESEGPYRMAYGPVYLSVPAGMEVQARLVLDEALSGGLSVAEGADMSAETDWERAEAEPGHDPDPP